MSHVKIVVAKTTTIAVDSIEEMAIEHIATTKITKNASSKSTNIVLFHFILMFFWHFQGFLRIFDFKWGQIKIGYCEIGGFSV